MCSMWSNTSRRKSSDGETIMPDLNVSDAIINDGRWSETIQVVPTGAVTNVGGYATHTTEDRIDVEVVLRPANVSEYTVASGGLTANAEYIMFVDSDQPVESGETAIIRGEEYNILGLEIDPYDGISMFEIVEETG